MKIHTRTLLILGATVFVLIFAMNFLAQFFILSSYAQIEQDDSVTDVQRVVDQIHREQSELAKDTATATASTPPTFFPPNSGDALEWRSVKEI